MSAEVYYDSRPQAQDWCAIISWGDRAFAPPCIIDTNLFSTPKSAEWIDEREDCGTGTGLSYLANFQYTQFSNGYADSTTRGQHTIAGFYPDRLIMVDDVENPNSTILAQPGDLSKASAFVDYYYNPGLDTGSNCDLP